MELHSIQHTTALGMQQFLNLRFSQEGWRCRWGSCRISNHHTVSDFSKGGGFPETSGNIFAEAFFQSAFEEKWMKSGEISIWPIDSLLLSVYHIIWYLESWDRAHLDWTCKFVDTNTFFLGGKSFGVILPKTSVMTSFVFPRILTSEQIKQVQKQVECIIFINVDT